MPTLGTEPRDGYLEIELAGAAHKLETEPRPVEPGHQALATSDTAVDARVVQATAEAVHERGGSTTYRQNKEDAT